MKRRTKLILGAAGLLLILAAGYAGWTLSVDDESDVIRISGNIEITDAEVSFKIPGVVAQRPVSEGEIVQAGDLVAKLESSELAQEVGLRRAELAAARATLAALTAGNRPEEIAQGAALRDIARAEAARDRVEYVRNKNLYEGQALSKQEAQRAEAAYRSSQARVREATERLALLRKGPRDEDIENARAQADRAEQALALAEIRLSYATLAAPMSGVVLSENLEPGEYAAPGMPIVTIGDLENVWLRGYVNETDLGRVKLSQKACVTMDTYPGKVYEGQLSFIASEAEFTPKSVQTTEARVKLVYRVKIDIPNPAFELKPGMPADATILLEGPEQSCMPSEPRG